MFHMSLGKKGLLTCGTAPELWLRVCGSDVAQATLIMLPAHCVLRLTQPPIFRETANQY